MKFTPTVLYSILGLAVQASLIPSSPYNEPDQVAFQIPSMMPEPSMIIPQEMIAASSKNSESEPSTFGKPKELYTTIAPSATIEDAETLEKRKVKSSIFITPSVIAGAIEQDDHWVDLYKCSNSGINITDPEDVTKVKYGCKYYAMASFYINVGEISVYNLTYLLNENSTYQENYKEYTTKLWQSLYSDFGSWLYQTGEDTSPGINYYTCSKDPNDRSKCINGKKFHDLYIADDELSAAATSLGKWYNMSELDKSVLGVVTESRTTETELKDKLTITNTTSIVIQSVLPDPISGLSVQNLTDLSNLVATAKDNIDKVSSIDLVDYLAPVVMYSSTSTNAMRIDHDGRQEINEDKKRRKMMILAIIFMILGAAASFLSFPAGLLVETTLLVAQNLATFAITGKFDVKGFVEGLAGCAFVLFQGLKLGKSIGESVNSMRMVKGLSGAATGNQLLKMTDAQKIMGASFNLSFNNNN